MTANANAKKRRGALVRNGFIALCLGVALALGQPAVSQAADRPNVVMIVSDDHGRDDMGAYGAPIVKTPNLDALARDGLRFTNAFATTSSCSPSRATLLTGRMNHNTGMYGLEHEESHFSTFNDVQSLPAMLKKGGYRTARIGKFHVAPKSVFAFDEVLSEGLANQTVSLARSPVEMADKTRAFVSAKGAPFFLYFATDDPHRAFPFDIGDKPNSFGNRPDGYPGIKETTYDPDEVIVPPFLPDTAEVRAELAQYYQSISRLDQGVGRLVEVLKAAGQYDNTIILYLTDNGVAFPGAKTTLYDAGLRSPLIMRLPGGRDRGQVSEAMVSLVDITPTLLEMTGVPSAGASLDGKSFAGLIDNPKADGWDEVFGTHTFHEVQMYYPTRMVRTRRYKLLYNIASELTFPFAEDLLYASSWRASKGQTRFGRRTVEALLHRPKFELYDVEADPDELVNLADDPAHAQIKAELIAKIKDFQARTRDPWLRKWDFQ